MLAAALLDGEGQERIIPRIATILRSGDFYDPRHALLWEVLLALHTRGEPVDVLTVVAELRVRDRLNTVGGAQYVGELTDEIPTLSHCESHARIVSDLAERRRALEAYQAATQRLLSGEALPAVRVALDRSLGTPNQQNANRVGQDIEAMLETMEARRSGQETAMSTPWSPVDSLLGGGLWPGMYVLVGGTGSGKTQWAVQVAVEAARRGQSVLYLALELSRQDLAARVIGTLSGVAWSQILRGTLDEVDVTRVMMAARVAEQIPFHTECGPPFGYGAETLAARAWALKPALIVIDYLQLCAGRHGEEPRTAVGRVSYVARALARDLGAVVLVLSSTARANYAELVNDPARDPVDLVGLGKESGEIEYAADGVMVLARSAEGGRKRVLVLAKNRHGPVGRADLLWNGHTFSVADGPREIAL
ncbi:MAG: AAA family ATPase [Deltaproteobacteria bacterium]|nr:AAA family ATPase [Deltaproteobacteria bacterium]MBK7069672.1 AAA family ATPase [Deltaproteobacteria bacterium]MBK8692567.1 AAA family ATPase [Deltaproteobacteria bacterium]